MSLPAALVLLNPAARGGRGRDLFARVRAALDAQVRAHVVESDPAGAWRSRVQDALGAGVRVFVAAGGDGTVNALVNALAELHARPSELALGAVGLGSSNDFHKPFDVVEGDVPLRVRVDRRTARDVARVRFAREDGTEAERVFLVSASLGLVADANAFFNEGGGLLGWLKRRWTGGAITYAAVRTLLAHRNLAADLTVDGAARRVALTNLSVQKTPFLSGTLRYDTPVAPDDGAFAVNTCEGMGTAAALGALLDLEKGLFLGKPGRVHTRAQRLEVAPERPAVLECDGEVQVVTRARFDILGEQIGVLG